MATFSTAEFTKTTPEEWQQKIEADLKGKPYQNLIKTTAEGIEILPNYTAQQKVNRLSKAASNAISLSATRDNWFINQHFEVSDAKAANQAILAALNAGVDSISVPANEPIDFAVLFNDIQPQHIEVRFISTSTDNLNKYIQWIDTQSIDRNELTGSFEVFCDVTTQRDSCVAMANTVLKHFPNMRLFTVNGAHFFNQGANQAQQLGVALSLANELIGGLIEGGIGARDAAKLIDFKYASGAHYFADIAKYRSAFSLWTVILNEYGVVNHPIQIHGVTSTWTQTIADINNNMLRGATQALSAVLGGCTTVTVTPFDASVRKSNDFAERMARNTQIMLRDEAFAGKVIDPSDGSYYIEYLTEEMCQKAWEYFMELENAGGYTQAVESGKIINDIAISKAKEIKLVVEEQQTVLGVNKYPNGMENVGELIQERSENNITTPALSDVITLKK